jgi:peptide/nickel transport system substrate-binding protein
MGMRDTETNRKLFDLNTVDRREFLGVLSAAGLSMAAGCAGGDDTDTPGSVDNKTDEGENTDTGQGLPEGGHLVITPGSAPPNLVPMTGSSINEYMTADFLYGKLTKLDADANVQPNIATDWEANDDASSWTFQLREDVQFNTLGKELLAEDVKATLDLIQNEDVVPGTVGTLGPIESTEVVNDHAVKINYQNQYSPAPEHLSARTGGIAPKEIIEEDHEQMVQTDYGAGPFNLDSYSAGEEVALVANPRYHATDDNGRQLPLYDRLTIQAIPDARQRIQAIADGRSDLNRRISPTRYEQAQGIDNVEAIQGIELEWYGVCMPTTMEPFDDVRVRKALKYAMDKEEQLKVAQNGYGKIAPNHPITPGYNISPEISDAPFGPEAKPDKAAELLDEAGYPDGIDLDTFQFSATSTPTAERFAQIWQQNAAEAGIEFDIQKVTRDQWLGDYWNTENYYWTSWSMKFPTLNMMQLAVHGDGYWNDAYFQDDDVDRLIDEAAATSNVDKRHKLFKNALQIVHEEGGWVIPFYKASLSAHSSRILNYEPHPTGQLVLAEQFAIEQ